ncbi:unnamed protein product [Paramecium primaurelia]|uniref:Uncharacterized protein n=1 Tax=Paramecium primaurelia TaxID=5886 RepID=A0A8S1NAN2_PARPR|nr:unnamed protein product [Paramecium primaurelia]
MGCVGQKQNQKQSQNMLHLQSQSISIYHSKRKMCIESLSMADPKQQIQLYQSIDISKDQEFVLKSVKKFIPKNSESPNSTPKFNQSLSFGIGIGNHRNKVII